MDAVTDRFLLTGKVALVTGGSRGLGREMVRAFARAGADVVIASRNAGSCAELATEVEAQTGRAALAVGCHVGHWDELPGLLDAAYERFGRLDVLVNNAGKSPLYPSLTDVDERMWDSVLLETDPTIAAISTMLILLTLVVLVVPTIQRGRSTG